MVAVAGSAVVPEAMIIVDTETLMIQVVAAVQALLMEALLTDKLGLLMAGHPMEVVQVTALSQCPIVSIKKL